MSSQSSKTPPFPAARLAGSAIAHLQGFCSSHCDGHRWCPQICQSNYVKDLLEWIDAENLPEWLGGKSQGTLIDDIGPWSDPEVLRKLEGQLPAVAKTLKHKATVSGTGEALSTVDEVPDGYQSPRYALPGQNGTQKV